MWLLPLTVLILALIMVPLWSSSTAWRGRTRNYYPGALFSLVLLLLLVLVLSAVA